MRNRYYKPTPLTLERVAYIRENPDKTGKELCHELQINHTTFWRLVQAFGLTYKSRITEKKEKMAVSKNGEFFNPDLYTGDYSCLI